MRHEPAAGAKEPEDPGEGARQVRLVHGEQACVGEIERGAQLCGVEFVEVAGDDLDAGQVKGGGRPDTGDR
jgi:hypothetical protein